MANEAVIITLGGDAGNVVQRTVGDGATIEKGSLCILTDPNTAAAVTTSGAWAGVAAAEKVASDGSTTLGFYTTGLFDMTAGTNTITIGQQVKMSGANLIEVATATDMLTGNWIGCAEETFSGSEVGLVRLRGF